MPNTMQQAEQISLTSDRCNTAEYPAPTLSSSSAAATSSTDPAPSSSSDCSSAVAGCVDFTPATVAVSVGPFLFEEARLRSMEAAVKPGETITGGDETRDRSKSARKALANSGRRPTSCYKGVNLHCRSNRWETHIWDGHQVHVGCFDTELQAAIAYDIVALKLRGAKAKLNFAASSYDAEMQSLEKMSREEVLMAMRGVTFKEETPKEGGDKQGRDLSPPRTRKHARQPSRLYQEAEQQPPVKRRRRAAPAAKQRGGNTLTTKGPRAPSAALKALPQAQDPSLPLPRTILNEIDNLSEPSHAVWPPVTLRPINTHYTQVSNPAPSAAMGVATAGHGLSALGSSVHLSGHWQAPHPDSPTLHPIHPGSVHPSDLMVNTQPTICTTQDTCSLLPNHWLTTSSAHQQGPTAGGCPAFLPQMDDDDEVDPLSQSMSMSAVSSDTNVSDVFGFEDLDQFDQSMLTGCGVDTAGVWNLTEFNPDTLLLEPDFVEPWLHC